MSNLNGFYIKEKKTTTYLRHKPGFPSSLLISSGVRWPRLLLHHTAIGAERCGLWGRGGCQDVLPPASAPAPVLPVWEGNKETQMTSRSFFNAMFPSECLWAHAKPPPCPLLILFSRPATVLQLLGSLVGDRRDHRGTSLKKIIIIF